MAKKINKKAKSILDDLESSDQTIANQISASTNDSPIVPPSIQEQMGDDFVNKVKLKTATSIKSLFNRLQNKQQVSDESVEFKVDAQQIMQEIKDVVDAEKIEVEDNLNIADVTETLESVVQHDAIENIPDIDPNNIDELVITETEKTRKSYIRTKISVKTPTTKHASDFKSMLSFLKKESSGAIRHRICDLRLIGNTNKTQLKGSDLKLLKNSYTIKPVGGIVNKSTRIIISINPDDDDTIIVYMQKSRDKFIAKIELNNNTDWEWLGEWIFSFYETLNFNLFKYKLLNRTYGEDPMYNLIKNIAKIGDFKVTLPKDQTKIDRFTFKPITGLNTHLVFNVFKKTVNVRNPLQANNYSVVVSSDIDRSLYLNLSAKTNSNNPVPFTLEQLNSESFFKSVRTFIKTFNNEEYEILDIGYDKLTKRNSRKAFMFLQSNNIEIVKVLSNDEINKKLRESGINPKVDYDAESIIFKHKSIDYGILQHLALNVGVDERGYKNRPYRFRLIYGLNGQEIETVDKSFEKLLKDINVVDNNIE